MTEENGHSRNQVLKSILIEVSHPGRRSRPRGGRNRREEASVADAELDCRRSIAPVRQVADPVGVEISCNNATYPALCTEQYWRLKRAITSTGVEHERRCRVSGAIIGHDQIRVAVSVEVPDGNRIWESMERNCCSRNETPVTITQEHVEFQKTRSRRHQAIKPAVIVEIANPEGP